MSNVNRKIDTILNVVQVAEGFITPSILFRNEFNRVLDLGYNDREYKRIAREYWNRYTQPNEGIITNTGDYVNSIEKNREDSYTFNSKTYSNVAYTKVRFNRQRSDNEYWSDLERFIQMMIDYQVKWGNGNARKTALTEAGYDYKTIQSLVNKLLKG